jgi:hypothetical protein
MKNKNLELVKKDSKTYQFRIALNRVPVDISGWQLYFTVKADVNDADSAAIISKDVTFPSNAESANGVGYLSLTSSDTNVPVSEYVYDLKFLDIINMRETFARGKFTILPTVRIT